MADDCPIDPHRIAADIEAAGNKWADLKHAAELLERTRSGVLARLTLHIKGEQSCSLAEAERLALTSEDYLDHIYAMVDAQHAANKGRVRFEAERARFDAMRTAEATRREEMRSISRT